MTNFEPPEHADALDRALKCLRGDHELGFYVDMRITIQFAIGNHVGSDQVETSVGSDQVEARIAPVCKYCRCLYLPK